MQLEKSQNQVGEPRKKVYYEGDVIQKMLTAAVEYRLTAITVLNQTRK
jgi:hypothetical protein